MRLLRLRSVPLSDGSELSLFLSVLKPFQCRICYGIVGMKNGQIGYSVERLQNELLNSLVLSLQRVLKDSMCFSMRTRVSKPTVSSL